MLPSLILQLPSEYLLRPRLVFRFVVVRLAQLTSDAVRQTEARDESVERFLVVEMLLGVEEPK